MTEGKRLEGVLEFQADVLKEDAAFARLEHLAQINKNFLQALETDQLIDNLNMDFTAFLLNQDPNDDLLVYDDVDVYQIPSKVFDGICLIYNKHKAAVDTDLYRYHDYMRGMYNGMEVLMSEIEQRDASFLSTDGKFYNPPRLRIEGGQSE